ncbi:adenylate/guanylate cyclase domain-containing protein [uncultured Methylobacterium sp.]|jgi:adenylate cyclase|uniref:adenylate/guanylate cyclase domain-containing protein n=1 Tax=uncultured Methylobacterium sp. TaxID=157278 RepID=UPI00262ABE86|nr:adenylate/guanylate cyclase domain-containing protein [uncultured Methylobacterium sp.]
MTPPPSPAPPADRRPAGGPVPAALIAQLASGPRALAMRLVVFLVLLTAAQVHDGSLHAASHWMILGGYALSSLWLGLVSLRRPAEATSWISTVLDAALAIYVVIEHMLAGSVGASAPGDVVSRLPAFLLLLQTGLTLRVMHTILFSVLVAGFWAVMLVVGLADPEIGAITSETIAHQAFGLLTFVAMSLFVIDGTLRLRSALREALRLEHERSALARFVPAGVDLVRGDGAAPLRSRHACLLALDIRGFSALTRVWGESEVVGWLLAVRALVHDTVDRHGGIVDKYVGDGVLAQFLDGTAAQQAAAALACADEISRRMEAANGERVARGLPALAVTVALHAGEVLVGVFDDGRRAEFTVLGPAMNALARIERRAKNDGLPLAASKRFLRSLGARAPADWRRLPRRAGEEDCPDLVAPARDSLASASL